MSKLFIISWRFLPPDYLEEPIYVKDHNYVLSSKEGEIESAITSESYDNAINIVNELSVSIKLRFLCEQIFRHENFEISEPSIFMQNPDGSKHYFLQAKPIEINVKITPIDIQIIDGNGIIKADSRRDRLAGKKDFERLVEKYGQTNEVLKSLLTSYHNAVLHPENEFIYLYEIRDALVKEFGNEKNAVSAIGVSRNSFDDFRKLACSEPLTQGRHRGLNFGNIRPATKEELAKARTIAKNMIEGYLKYLENQK